MVKRKIQPEPAPPSLSSRWFRYRHKRPKQSDAEVFLRNGHFSVTPSDDVVYAEERKKRLEELESKLAAMLRDDLAKVRRLDLAILKCHQLSEYMVDQFIDLMGGTEGALGDARLSFPQRLAIVHLLGFPKDPLLLPSLDLLNTIRNQVAHTLVADRRLIDKLIRMNSENPEEEHEFTDGVRVRDLKGITRFFCWQLFGHIQAKHAFEMWDWDWTPSPRVAE